MRDLQHRQTAVALALAGVRRDLVALAEADAHTNARLDRLGDRVTRLEKRLELHEPG